MFLRANRLNVGFLSIKCCENCRFTSFLLQIHDIRLKMCTTFNMLTLTQVYSCNHKIEKVQFKI